MKLRLFAAFSLLTVLFNSCKTDLDILADYKAIPVIYGIINHKDSVHYIRVQKAFLGAGDAYFFSQNPDSNYFKDITVTLAPFKINETSGDTIFGNPKLITLAETFIPNKDQGEFFGGSQKVYFTTTKLDSTYSLLLKVYNNENGEVYSSSTSLLDRISWTTPNTNGVVTLASQLGSYINYTPTWDIGSKGYVSDLSLVVKYRAVYETSNGNKDTIPSQVTWKQSSINKTQFNNTSKVFLALSGEEFYKFLQEAIPVPGDTLVRIFDGIDFVADVGAYELYNFLNLNQPTTTIVQDKPIYSNIEGGYGLFSSRLTGIQKGKLLNSPSTKELKEGKYTAGLKFQWP
jgi:hypothetical protein